VGTGGGVGAGGGRIFGVERCARSLLVDMTMSNLYLFSKSTLDTRTDPFHPYKNKGVEELLFYPAVSFSAFSEKN